MAAEDGPGLVDDVAGGRLQPGSPEEAAVVAARQEARLLALGTTRRSEAGRLRLRSHLFLLVPAQREPTRSSSAESTVASM